ncbi:MAG: molybdate ABC transporter substrate-binding protein, partial [Desulfobacteraceae bacterium]
MRSNKYFLPMLTIVMTLAVFMGGMAATGPVQAADEALVVFAAASTTNALTDIGELYAARKLGQIKTSFASSSTLAKQIDSGAPVDVYLSANKKWMDFLEEKKLLAEGTRCDLLNNRIVLIAPAESSLEEIQVTSEFPLVEKLGTDGRLAMGDPEHVPAGMYGKQALENLGVWENVKGRVAPMKDVRAALALVERGETPLGVVYATDAAITPKVRVVGTFPEESHPPIVYPAAVIADGKVAAAKKFVEFLKSDDAKA